MEKHLPFLRALPLFAGLAEPDILHLLQSLHADELCFTEQQIIWEPFRREPYLCVTTKGCIRLMQEDSRGNRSIIGSFTAGDIISGSSLGTEGALPFYLHVKADTAAIVFSLPDGQGEIAPVFLRNLANALLQNETRLLRKVETLGRRTTREKLMSYLAVQAAKQGSRTVSVDFTRQELADYLCADRSAMCTELTRMQKEGLIRFHKHAFTLLVE